MSHNHANENWQNHVPSGPLTCYDSTAQLAVLMDIRGELRRIRAVLECDNAIDIPNILRRIDVNTKRKVKARKPKPRGRKGGK